MRKLDVQESSDKKNLLENAKFLVDMSATNNTIIRLNQQEKVEVLTSPQPHLQNHIISDKPNPKYANLVVEEDQISYSQRSLKKWSNSNTRSLER